MNSSAVLAHAYRYEKGSSCMCRLSFAETAGLVASTLAWTTSATVRDPILRAGRSLVTVYAIAYPNGMSVEDLNSLVNVVEEHYRASQEPLQLARLGQVIAPPLRGSLLAEYGRLSTAIEAAGGDRVQLLEAGTPGRVTVVTPAVREDVEKRLLAVGVGGSAQFDKLPAPVRIAFCVKTEPGERVAVRTTPPMQYVRLQPTEPVPPPYILLDAKYRKPGLKLDAASVSDKAQLWRAYLDWANSQEIDANLLTSRKPAGNALERLLAAQPADIVDRMNLPADIVALLLKHS